MNFSHFKIGVKLGIIFAVLVVMTALTGAFALVQMSAINGNSEDIAENWLPSVQYVGEMQFYLSESRSAELLHALAVGIQSETVLVDVPLLAVQRQLALLEFVGFLLGSDAAFAGCVLTVDGRCRLVMRVSTSTDGIVMPVTGVRAVSQ